MWTYLFIFHTFVIDIDYLFVVCYIFSSFICVIIFLYSLVELLFNWRVQRVEIGGVLSEEINVKNGVPQGSVLGPHLFLLYINGIQAVHDCNLFLYSDDSALLISDNGVGIEYKWI